MNRLNYVEAAETEALEELAFRAFREWLCSPNFRNRAKLRTALESTSIGRAIQRRTEQHWQWWLDEEGQRLRELWSTMPRIWEQKGWVVFERARMGRPRRAEYSSDTLRKARSIYGSGHQGWVSDATWAWAESVLGERSASSTQWCVVVSEAVFHELASRLKPEELEGLSRHEVAAALDLPKHFANHFVRYLTEQEGWTVVQVRRDGTFTRELRRPT
jgi:hypothetical protein